MTILAVLVVVIALAWWDAGVQSRRLKATHLEMLRISSCLAWVDARPPVDNYLPMAEKLGPMCPHGLSGRDGWGNPIQIGFVASTTASQPDWVVWSGGRDGMPDSLDPSDYVHGPNRRIKDDHVYSPAHTMVGRPQDPWQFGWWRLRYGPSAP